MGEVGKRWGQSTEKGMMASGRMIEEIEGEGKGIEVGRES